MRQLPLVEAIFLGFGRLADGIQSEEWHRGKESFGYGRSAYPLVAFLGMKRWVLGGLAKKEPPSPLLFINAKEEEADDGIGIGFGIGGFD